MVLMSEEMLEDEVVAYETDAEGNIIKEIKPV
jgi:hypothetical protein